jgi:hypothetical protein
MKNPVLYSANSLAALPKCEACREGEDFGIDSHLPTNALPM